MRTPTAAFVVGLAFLLVPAGVRADDPFTALGSAGGYALLGVADVHTGPASGVVQLGSEAHVFGDVGARWRLETAAGVVVEGDAHHGSGGVLHGGSVRGSDSQLSEAAWAAVQADAHAAVQRAYAHDATLLPGSSASACSGSPTSSGSMGSRTLTADPNEDGLSVYEIDGCLFLAGGESLTVEGTPDDRFVVRVTGGLRLDGGSRIALDGLPGSAVLFVFDGGGWAGEPWAQVTVWEGSVDNGASLSGVFLAPWMYWQLGDGTDLPDTRILAGGVQANIQDLYPTGSITGVPEETEPEEDTGAPAEGTGMELPIWGGDRCPPRGDALVVAETSPGSGSCSGTSGSGSSSTGSASHVGGASLGGAAGRASSGSCGLGLVPGSGALALLGFGAAGLRRRKG